MSLLRMYVSETDIQETHGKNKSSLAMSGFKIKFRGNLHVLQFKFAGR
jgi:hypothetical protein